MNSNFYIFVILIFGCLLGGQVSSVGMAQDVLESDRPTLEQVKSAGALRSSYRNPHPQTKKAENKSPQADLKTFQTTIQPALKKACYTCHASEDAEGDFRVDTLDPDLLSGEDSQWWLEVMNVLSNGEMPPADADVKMTDADRTQVVDWLSGQVLLAAQTKRSESGHSSFRRMTRYEFNYALQDLLGLPQELAADLLPETVSEDGFRNSSEMLQMTSRQFETYRDIARKALTHATVRGERPEPTSFAITMGSAETNYEDWVERHFKDLELKFETDPLVRDMLGKFRGIREQMASGESTRGGGYFLNRETGESWDRHFPYGFSLWKPTDQKLVAPKTQPVVMVLPHGGMHQIDVGNYLPDRGMVKIRFRANRVDSGDSFPSLRLSFGYRPSNNSRHEYVVSDKDIAVTAPPEQPQFYEWLVPLDGMDRNPYLRKSKLATMPNPSEFFAIRNVHQSGGHAEQATVHIDYVEIITPFVTEWPTKSHRRVFPEQAQGGDETSRAREVLASFMPRAWRRPVSDEEIKVRLALFEKIRPTYADFQETMIQVLSTVLASPHFIYLSQSDETITDHELASRLSFFLWSSQPDEELFKVAASGRIREPGVLEKQVERMLADPRAKRFAAQFTHQWLGMELLDFLQVDRDVHPSFSSELQQSMLQEPIEFFRHVLNENRSVMDFLHADYTFLNQRLARHYGMFEVFGNHFRKVDLPADTKRGGLLGHAGLLAMNSDGKDSHPLKRGIWLLESLLHDPPPPPPPAVPEIDLADPEILKMTLKERIEDHRNDPACASCHAKIDPWGIAFENFDAVGVWRDEINGKPVDATSSLYNQSELAGMDGLKRYLLENRQDQFARAMVHKLASYSLGRPLSFSDRAEVERITAELRQQGDGLQTLIQLLVKSELFQGI